MIFGAVAGLIGTRGDRRWVDASRRAAYFFAGLMAICFVVVEVSFLTDDFSLSVVTRHSSVETPVFYKLTAMWSSQEGSLLLWASLLSIVTATSLRFTRNRLRDVVPWASAVMMGIAVFFTGLMLFGGGVNPFATLDPVPLNGSGLNPLLQHPAMMAHPPMLYTGYVALTVPFAFAIGALASRRIDAAWIRSTRGFSLIAWTFLTCGIILGARWSYTELGWGGYWAWDPVENASLMPWLITTAFIHSIMVQEKRGMLKVWNASLVVASFTLALVGTFLVRSGVLQSIHAFGDSTVGPFLLGLIAVVVISSAILIISRMDMLRSNRRIESLLSREAMFLVNNLLLVVMAAVIFWGTFFPLISEALTGTRSTLAAPWFDRYTTPLAVILVLFVGIGSVVTWRRVSLTALRRLFTVPLLVAAAVTVLLTVFTHAADNLWALTLFAFGSFTVAAMLLDTWRSAAARRSASGAGMARSIGSLATRNRRRYGGFIVHLGLVVLLVGVAVSSTYDTRRDVELRPGESAAVGDYRVTYLEPTASRDDQALTFGARLKVEKEGAPFASLHPMRRYFQMNTGTRTLGGWFDGEATSEVGLEPGVISDFWAAVEPNTGALQKQARARDREAKVAMPVMLQLIQNPGAADLSALGGTARQTIQGLQQLYLQNPDAAMSGLTELMLKGQDRDLVQLLAQYRDGQVPVTFRVIVSPMTGWIWVGALIGLFGALFALWPSGLAGRFTARAGSGGRRRQATDEDGPAETGEDDETEPVMPSPVSAATGEGS